MLSINRSAADQKSLGLGSGNLSLRCVICTLTVCLCSLSTCWGATSVVPDDECDPLATGGVSNANCPTHSLVCTAAIGGFVVTDEGTPGPDITGQGHECNSCKQCNPDPSYTPPPTTQICTASLSVSFTAEVSLDRSYSISSGTLSSTWLEAEAGITFGNSAGTTVTFTATCGTETHAPCTIMPVDILLSTIEGMTAEAEVLYSWTGTKNGFPSDPACPSTTTSGVFVQDGGSTKITATGTKAGRSRCELGAVTDCP